MSWLWCYDDSVSLSLSLCFLPSFWPQWRSSVLMEAWWATGGKIPVIRSLVSPCFSSACHKTALVIIFVPIYLPLTFKDQPLNSKPHSYSVHHPLEGHQNHYPLQGSRLPTRTQFLRVRSIPALLEIHLERRCWGDHRKVVSVGFRESSCGTQPFLMGQGLD